MVARCSVVHGSANPPSTSRSMSVSAEKNTANTTSFLAAPGAATSDVAVCAAADMSRDQVVQVNPGEGIEAMRHIVDDGVNIPKATAK